MFPIQNFDGPSEELNVNGGLESGLEVPNGPSGGSEGHEANIVLKGGKHKLEKYRQLTNDSFFKLIDIYEKRGKLKKRQELLEDILLTSYKNNIKKDLAKKE